MFEIALSTALRLVAVMSASMPTPQKPGALFAPSFSLSSARTSSTYEAACARD